MNSFFPRAIRLWNELPTEIKDAPTVPAFASGLNKFYALIDILFKLFYVFIKKFILKLSFLLRCQCSGLAHALCSQY